MENKKMEIFSVRERRQSKHKFGRNKVRKAEEMRR